MPSPRSVLPLALLLCGCGGAREAESVRSLGSWEWTWVPEGREQSTYGTAVVADPGGVFVTGFYDGGLYGSWSEAQFGSTLLPLRGETGTFVVRLDTAGNVVWARSYGDGGSVSPGGLARDHDGGLYVVGKLDPAVMDGAPGTWVLGDTTLTAEEPRAFVARLDSLGAVRWVRLVDGMATANAVSVDPGGRVYVGGGTGVDPAIGEPGDGVISSFSTDGDPIWTATVTDGGPAMVNGLARVPGGLCASGFVTGTGGVYGFVVGYDADGAETWRRTFAAAPTPRGSSGKVLLYGAAPGADGSCVVSGGFAGALAVGPSRLAAADDPSESAGHSDAVVVKVGPRGEPVWATQVEGGPVSDFLMAVTVGSGGEVMATGTFMGTAVFGPDTLVAPRPRGGPPVRVPLVVRLSGAGAPVGALEGEASGVASASGISTAVTGATYVTGEKGGNVFVSRVRW